MIWTWPLAGMAVLVASSQNLLTLVLLGVFTLVGIVVGEYARIKSRGKLMRKLKYALWAATLATVWWIVALVSAVVGGKGIARVDSEAGVIDA